MKEENAMLEKQAWIKLAPEMMIAWQQALDEGKDVEQYQSACERIVEESKKQDMEKIMK